MGNRIFIAINFPKNIREKLYRTKDEYLDLPCKWTRRDNLHLTLFFLGNLKDEEVLATCQTVEEIGKKHSPFTLELNNISFGPPKKMPPRMVWANGLPSKELTSLKNDLENSLYEKVPAEMNEENHAFSPHVTLARIKEWQLKQMEIEEIPIIDKDINLKILVSSIEVMASELKKEGPEYTVLASIGLSFT
ncbi:RNA 2',3'-cyclic phosphodiesterase [Candidatus Parcubacteria bacterium]|nr:RNA 2',3'-cyclic phosphodiesterase [Patescibacteria group bacterium]MBU4466795.1 RNA 2',3'-cyclic phosphodiesterase [Patescibacteria group bacterium]MCG2688369.1 RNA 2',3'-cyclic phosphodiesterase [Candidatus Parcubacteria bacterium]